MNRELAVAIYHSLQRCGLTKSAQALAKECKELWRLDDLVDASSSLWVLRVERPTNKSREEESSSSSEEESSSSSSDDEEEEEEEEEEPKRTEELAPVGSDSSSSDTSSSDSESSSSSTSSTSSESDDDDSDDDKQDEEDMDSDPLESPPSKRAKVVSPEDSDSEVSDVQVSDVSSEEVSSSSSEDDDSNDDDDKEEDDDESNNKEESDDESNNKEEDDDESNNKEESDDESNNHEDHLKRQQEARRAKAQAAAAAAAAWQPKTSPTKVDITTLRGTDGAQALSAGKPFQRVDSQHWGQVALQEAVADNSYQHVFGNDGFGAKSSETLLQTRGKRFQHEKTKRKRSFNGLARTGGRITMTTNSTKFVHHDDSL